MNIQNNRAAEALYSTTYVEDYLDTLENLPDEIQRLVSRLVALDLDAQKYFKKVREYFAQLVPLNRSNRHSYSEAVDKEIARIHGHITIILMKSQDIGDEKIQIAQQIQDFVDNRVRQLDIDRKTLDSVQQAETTEISSNPLDSTQHRGSLELSTPERGIKRVRRARLGLSVPIPSPKEPVPETVNSPISLTPSSITSQQQNSILDKRPSVITCLSSPTSSISTIVEPNKNSVQQRPVTPPSQIIETRKDPTTAALSPLMKKKSNDSEMKVVTPDESERRESTEKKPDSAKTPKKLEKRQVEKKSERKHTTGSTTRTAATKRKARQLDERDDKPPVDDIDPDEATYCLCDQVSYGEMIGCDNDLCPIEWFHFSCVSLTSKPKGKWFCPNCRGDRPNVMKPKAVFLKELDKYNRDKEEK